MAGYDSSAPASSQGGLKGGFYDPKVPVGDEKAMVTWAKRLMDEGHGLPEREVYMNLAFMLGHQWVEWDVRQRRLESPRVRRGDPNAPVRITVNKIGSLVERVISRLTKSFPMPECRPVTEEEEDIGSAKVGTRILQSEMNRMQFDILLPRLYFWVVPLGWSFVHVYWCPDKGAYVGANEETGDRVSEGEIDMTIVPGVEMKVDPNARSWVDVRYCVRTTGLTRAAIYEQYGVIKLVGETAPIRAIADDLFKLSDGQVGNADAERQAKVKAERLAVHQLWLKPGGRSHPKGLVMTWCGSTVLEMITDYPYDHNELPFIPFSLLPGLGHPEGRTWVGDLRGMQRDYNDARSREATIRRTLVPKLLAARGQIDPSRLTSRVEVVDYAPTGPTPTWLVPDGRWMSQFESAMTRANGEMGDRAGQNEASQGQSAAGAPAAAILALQEADESKLAISAREMSQGLEKLGWQVLMLVKQFWTEQRLVRTWSEDDRLQISRFQGSDLAGQLDVHVSSESQLPKSKAARAQLALDLWDRHIMTDPAQFIRLLEVPGISFLQEDFDRATRQAEREYSKIMTGEMVDPQDWHEHQAHIARHKQDMSTEEYEDADPQAQQGMQQHLKEHYMWLQYQTTGVLPPGLAGGGMPGAQGGGGQQLDNMPNNPQGDNPAYLNPATGMPPDTLAGEPSALTMNPPPSLIGGPGQQGAVPGIPQDQQLAQTGQ